LISLTMIFIMIKYSNNAELAALLKLHGLSSQAVVDLYAGDSVRVSISTIEKWRAVGKGIRNMPDVSLALLKRILDEQ
jgi:hypothetical protein